MLPMPAYAGIGSIAQRLMKEQCGLDAPVITYDLEGSTAASLGTVMTSMKAQNVTTLFMLVDVITNIAFTQLATQNAYFPEWFIPGMGALDLLHNGRLYDPQQWPHAFGYSLYEIPKPESEQECYKAYREIDPDNSPNGTVCHYHWVNMVQLFGGMQDAGPNLTPHTFRRALFEKPQLPPDPPWRMAGGYGPNDHTFPDWAAEIWWDPEALGSDGQAGTYRFPNRGRRYTFGTWDRTDHGLFREGVALASELE